MHVEVKLVRRWRSSIVHACMHAESRGIVIHPHNMAS